MTLKEFKQQYFQNMHGELCFMYGNAFHYKYKRRWHTTNIFINHGKRFKKQWHDHMYRLRRIDYLTLQYK